MAPLAELDELADRLGVALPEGSPERARATSALSDASALVLAETGQTWAAPSEAPPVVATVVLQAAERKFRNPAGTTTRGAGPFSEGFSTLAASGVYLTEDERRILARFAVTRGGLQSVPVIRGDVLTDRGRPVPVSYADGTIGTSLRAYYGDDVA